ncbi:MAG: hypothetical protein ACRCYQ_02940, partial [Nocardioides sp.]
MGTRSVLPRLRRHAVETLRRLSDRPDGGTDAARPGRAVNGMVEEFSRRLIVGWISVPSGTPPTQVTLHLGDLQASATFATPGSAMSGYRSALRRSATGSPGSARSTTPLSPGGRRMLEGPAEDRRNSRQEVRTFSFRIKDIWAYVGPRTKVTVRVGGRPLPIYRHGMFLSPPRRGRKQLDDLRALFDQGHLLTQKGRVQLSKQLDTGWQSAVMGLYEKTQKVVRAAHDYDVFFIYGTLLGAVREGGYISHDMDFDAAYISRHRTGPEAARELSDIALALIAEGLRVDAHHSSLHIYDPDGGDDRIDLFHTWFDTDGLLRFPFGIAGTTTFGEAQWKGTRPITFPGGTGL